MSNKTQLQTNNTTLDSLITRVNAAKDVAASLPEAGGSGGGGNIETCTVNIVNNSVGWISGYYMTVVNGEKQCVYIELAVSDTISIQSVCNDFIILCDFDGIGTIFSETSESLINVVNVMHQASLNGLYISPSDSSITGTIELHR